MEISGGGGGFPEFEKRVKIVRFYIKLETRSVQDHKKSFKITILAEIRFISIKTLTLNVFSAK